jgi:Uma2 family endonuclease
LSDEARTKFSCACPEVVIEILADSDGWPALIRKLDMYARNGARFGVVIDPQKRRFESRDESALGLHLDYEAIMDA